MAQFLVQGPDGARHVIEGPDDATPQQVEAFATKTLGAPDPKSQGPTEDYYNNFAVGQTGAAAQPTGAGDARSAELTRPKPSPLDVAADARVAKEAAGGLVPQVSPVEGLPFGSWLDEASAGLDAGLNWATGGKIGQPYDEALAYQHARQRYAENNSKKLGDIPTPWGDVPVTTSGLTKLYGAIGTAPSFPMPSVFKGTSLLPRMGNGAIGGGLYGGLYGAGEEEGGRASNAKTGLFTGAALGGILPPIADAAGNGLGWLTRQAQALPAELKGYSKEAVDVLSRIFDADNVQFHPNGPPLANHGEVSPNPIPLGPDRTVGDLGPGLRQTTSALAARPDTMGIVRPVYEARGNSAPDRIQASANRALGNPENIPQALDEVKAHFNGLAKPHYDEFHQTPIITTPDIASVMDDIRTSLPGTVKAAQKLAAGEGYRTPFKITEQPDAMTPMTGVNKSVAEPVPSGIEYDYIKRAVDDVAKKAAPGSNEQRIYSTLARRLRNAVDEALSPADPAQSPWAKARGFAETGFDGKEGLLYGQKAFKNGITPDQLAYDLRGKSAYEQAAIRAGYRDALRTAMGTKSSVLTARGDSAARAAFNSEFGRQKLRMIAETPDRADELIRRIEAESVMADTGQKVLRNSETASRQQINKLLPDPLDKTKPYPLGIEQIPSKLVNEAFGALTNQAVTEAQIRRATDVAKMLVAQGQKATDVANGLRKYLAGKNLSNRSRVALTRVINTIANGSRNALVDRETRQRRSLAAP